MKGKQTITVLLILVMSLQLLPVKQAVRYFFVDNLMIEEIVHINKNATKNFRLIDEDHNLFWENDHLSPQFSLLNSAAFFQYAEILPVYHSADIHTPPPNVGTI
ncbi:MAG: hypothetical protein Q7T76_20930 [Ferruginibacter sp.]|nr:hypothetical protein [Ferruginibacter sp.]